METLQYLLAIALLLSLNTVSAGRNRSNNTPSPTTLKLAVREKIDGPSSVPQQRKRSVSSSESSEEVKAKKWSKEKKEIGVKVPQKIKALKTTIQQAEQKKATPPQASPKKELTKDFFYPTFDEFLEHKEWKELVTKLMESKVEDVIQMIQEFETKIQQDREIVFQVVFIMETFFEQFKGTEKKIRPLEEKVLEKFIENFVPSCRKNFPGDLECIAEAKSILRQFSAIIINHYSPKPTLKNIRTYDYFCRLYSKEFNG